MTDTPEKIMQDLIAYIEFARGMNEQIVNKRVAEYYLDFSYSMRRTYPSAIYDGKPALYKHEHK